MTLPAGIKKLIVDYYCNRKTIDIIVPLAMKNSLFRQKLLSFYNIWYIENIIDRINICKKQKIKNPFIRRLKKLLYIITNILFAYKKYKTIILGDLLICECLCYLDFENLIDIIKKFPELLNLEYFSFERLDCSLKYFLINYSKNEIIAFINMGLKIYGIGLNIMSGNEMVGKYYNLLDENNVDIIYKYWGIDEDAKNKLRRKIRRINAELKN